MCLQATKFELHQHYQLLRLRLADINKMRCCPYLDDEISVIVGNGGIAAHQLVCCCICWQFAELHVISKINDLHIPRDVMRNHLSFEQYC